MYLIMKRLGVFNLSVQFNSVAQSCLTLCDPMNHSTPGLAVHHQLPELILTHVPQSVMPSSHCIHYRPLLLLAPIPPRIRVFSNESTLHTPGSAEAFRSTRRSFPALPEPRSFCSCCRLSFPGHLLPPFIRRFPKPEAPAASVVIRRHVPLKI